MNAAHLLKALEQVGFAASDLRKGFRLEAGAAITCARMDLRSAAQPLTDTPDETHALDALNALLLRCHDRLRNFDSLQAEIEGEGEGPAHLEHLIRGDLNLAQLWIKQQMPEKFDTYGHERKPAVTRAELAKPGPVSLNLLIAQPAHYRVEGRTEPSEGEK